MEHHMNPRRYIALLLPAALYVGCATGGQRPDVRPAPKPGTAGMTENRQKRPNDFHIEFTWTEGSLPPPYHYEYTITIQKTGAGEIVMTPDYAFAKPPTWTERFKLTPDQLDTVFQELAHNGLFTHTWHTLDPSPVGGSHRTLLITADGKQHTVSDYLKPDDNAHGEAIFSAVQALVPKVIMTKLEARRTDYVSQHERR